MSQVESKNTTHQKKWGVLGTTVAIVGIVIILLTLEISRRNIIPFIASQREYIVGIEIALLGVFVIERLVRVIVDKSTLQHPEIIHSAARLRLMVRILGYMIAFICIVSVIASDSELAVSVGTVVGVAGAFAIQNIMSSVLASVLIMNTGMVRIGEEITVTGITGTIADINLIHTIVQVNNDIIYVPNSVIVSSAVRRKKRMDN